MRVKCANPGCNNTFEQTRKDKRCCSNKCRTELSRWLKNATKRNETQRNAQTAQNSQEVTVNDGMSVAPLPITVADIPVIVEALDRLTAAVNRLGNSFNGNAGIVSAIGKPLTQTLAPIGFGLSLPVIPDDNDNSNAVSEVVASEDEISANFKNSALSCYDF